MALKDPIVEEATVVGDVVTVDPSYLMVIVEEDANPDPVTVTVVPTMPPVGLRLIEALIENIADAVFEDASVAVTVWAPNGDAGMLNDAVNEPKLSVVVVVSVEGPKVTVIVDVGEKLVPETVTGEPTGPDGGLKVIPGERMKVEEAECEDASVAVML